MINDNDDNNQLPKEMKAIFTELEILKHLRNAGIKNQWASAVRIYFNLSFV